MQISQVNESLSWGKKNISLSLDKIIRYVMTFSFRGAYLKIESERFNLGEIEEYPIHRSYNETNDSYNQ